MTAFRAFKIDWRAKALAFRTFDAVPFGHRLYYLTQRKVTRTIPRVLSPTAETGRWFTEHHRTFRDRFAGELERARLFEFGAGWDLFGNLVLWCHGLERQTLYDLRRWARPDQVNVVIRHLRGDPPPGARRLPERELREDDGGFEEDLRVHYGIDYRAPADAGATGLPDGSVDLVATTSVLEHVPGEQLARLLRECRRLMHAGSVMSHVIDYSDHYAHSDPAITPYNFLRFTEEEWRRFNPGIHFQNRWRHADHLRLFAECGLRVVADRVEQPPDAAALLAGVPLAPPFRGRPAEELAPLVGHVVLVKA